MSKTFSQPTNAPWRADVVGSFLRPECLLAARESFEKNQISQEELTAIENREIEILIKKQKAAGMHVITDGEFRRHSWHLDFMWGLNGIRRVELDHGYVFCGIETYHTSVQLEGKISGENHPFVQHFKFVKQFEDDTCVARQTIPAPAQVLSELYRAENVGITKQIYPEHADLERDLAAAYRTVIKDLAAAGCRNIQFDDCTWGMIVDDNYMTRKYGHSFCLEFEANKFLSVNNLALQDRPSGVVINSHVCRGNYQSAYASTGPYDKIAPIFFAKENVDGYYLEFDDSRSGSFDCLRHVGDDKIVVLGLITTKRAALEDKEFIKQRIAEASKFVPLERLRLSPQCGFSSNAVGNKITEEDQWNKIKLVQQIAQEVWG